jgi:hypothetical protein
MGYLDVDFVESSAGQEIWFVDGLGQQLGNTDLTGDACLD